MQYTIVKQRRKTATIVISEKQEVIVKVPYYMTKKQIDCLIAEHEQWIKDAVAGKKEQRALNDWFLTGKQLYLGTYWPVKIKTVYGGNSMLIFNKELGFVLSTDGSEVCARQEMEKFYRLKAREYLTPIVDEYADLIDVKYNEITIRKQATRWGSCSYKGNLSFNMKIMCAPPEMVRYVVLHEVVHLKHFNHSSAFWQEVERWMPDYKEKMNHFKQYGQNFII